MAGNLATPKGDTRLEIGDLRYEGYTSSSGLIFLTEKERKLLDLDIKEPSGMARDLIMERYKNCSPKFQDFAEAVCFIMNTTKYVQRIEALVKYERHLFFKQRPELHGFTSNEEAASLTECNYSHKGEGAKTLKDSNDPGYLRQSNAYPAIYGQHLLHVLENVIDAVEGKVTGEDEEDYHYRRGQAAIEFVTSFYHLRYYEQTQTMQEDQHSSITQRHINTFLFDTFQEGTNLLHKREFKSAATKYLDATFACMCRLRQTNEKSANILKHFLYSSTVTEDAEEPPDENITNFEQNEGSNIKAEKNGTNSDKNLNSLSRG